MNRWVSQRSFRFRAKKKSGWDYLPDSTAVVKGLVLAVGIFAGLFIATGIKDVLNPSLTKKKPSYSLTAKSRGQAQRVYSNRTAYAGDKSRLVPRQTPRRLAGR